MINCDLKMRILFTKNNFVFDEIRGVIVRVYNCEKLSLMSRNDIDKDFDFVLIGVH